MLESLKSNSDDSNIIHMERKEKSEADFLNNLVLDAGPEAALEYLHNSYDVILTRKIRYLLFKSGCVDPNSHKEDVRQDLWLAVHRDLMAFSEGKKSDGYINPFSWLYTIAHNLSVRHNREDSKEKGRSSLSYFMEEIFEGKRVYIPELTEFRTAESTHEEAELIKNINIYLSTLPKDESLIMASRTKGLSYKTIAAFLEITEASARQKYSRVISKIRKHFLSER